MNLLKSEKYKQKASETMEADRGIWKVCPICNKRFYILYPDLWVYKKVARVKKAGNQEMVYFDKYSCKRKFEDEYSVEVTRRRSDALKKMHSERRKKKLETVKKEAKEPHYCYECGNSVKNMFGFYECVLNPNANMQNRYCKRFTPKE